MKQGDFERRRREQMIENGEIIAPLDLTISDKIELILTSIDKIIHPQAQSDETPYNILIRQYVEKLRQEGKSDEEIYDTLITENLPRHPMLSVELGRRGVASIDLLRPRPDAEFDQ